MSRYFHLAMFLRRHEGHTKCFRTGCLVIRTTGSVWIASENARVSRLWRMAVANDAWITRVEGTFFPAFGPFIRNKLLVCAFLNVQDFLLDFLFVCVLIPSYFKLCA